MTDQRPTPPMTQCEHGLPVDNRVPIQHQCQDCDWCANCEAVRQFLGENCMTCDWEWGTDPFVARSTQPVDEDRLMLVCDDCGEAFDTIATANAHVSPNMLHPAEFKDLPPAYTIKPESEAM